MSFHDIECSKFIRWEIGEEPQLRMAVLHRALEFIRWEIGEEPQLEVIPNEQMDSLSDGRSGRNRNSPQRCCCPFRVYPMGDRGGTATSHGRRKRYDQFIRWEIGEEPQRTR